MSGTKRTPINRPQRRRFEPQTLEAFRRLRDHRDPCTCEPIDWRGRYWEHGEPCASCNRWWDLHGELTKHWPNMKPWMRPLVLSPAAQCPYPPDHAGTAEWHEKHREPAERWRTIETALAEYDQMHRSSARS
jgi:hypothetical protein